GERLALIGPNGAGKTTFVDLVTGAIKPDAGHVLIGGKEITGKKMAERVRWGLVRSFQITRLFEDMTPEEHLALAILQREGRSNRLAGHYSAKSDVMSEVQDILRQLGLERLGRLRVREIAYGQQ